MSLVMGGFYECYRVLKFSEEDVQILKTLREREAEILRAMESRK